MNSTKGFTLIELMIVVAIIIIGIIAAVTIPVSAGQTGVCTASTQQGCK